MIKFEKKSWPIQNAIKIVKGNGQAEIAVFEDPNCGYCQRLNQETLEKLDNITIYVFLWPFLEESSVALAESILSSKDPVTALEEWMIKGIEPSAQPTQHSLEVVNAITELVNELGVRGTPAIFTPDGHGPYGFVTPQVLARKLNHQDFF